MQPNEKQPAKGNNQEERGGSTEQMQENRQGQQDTGDTKTNMEGRNVNVENRPGPEIDENRR